MVEKVNCKPPVVVPQVVRSGKQFFVARLLNAFRNGNDVSNLSSVWWLGVL